MRQCAGRQVTSQAALDKLRNADRTYQAVRRYLLTRRTSIVLTTIPKEPGEQAPRMPQATPQGARGEGAGHADGTGAGSGQRGTQAPPGVRDCDARGEGGGPPATASVVRQGAEQWVQERFSDDQSEEKSEEEEKVHSLQGTARVQQLRPPSRGKAAKVLQPVRDSFLNTVSPHSLFYQRVEHVKERHHTHQLAGFVLHKHAVDVMPRERVQQIAHPGLCFQRQAHRAPRCFQ